MPWSAAVWRLQRGEPAREGLRVWVGGRERPYLTRHHAESASWLMVSAAGTGERVWAIECCVRCPAVAAVVADGRGLDFTATRRLQLAVERAVGERDCGRVILLRDLQELTRPSAARVRGVVWPEPSTDGSGGGVVRWNAQLLRRKGMRPTDDLGEGDRVVLEVRHGQVVVVHPSADVADRSAASAATA